MKGPNQDHDYVINNQMMRFSPLATRSVPREHPRLFGSLERLRSLAKERPEAYRKTKQQAARELTTGSMPAWDSTLDFGSQLSPSSKMISMALVAVIEGDAAMGRAAIDLAFKHYLGKPVQEGHATFGGDCGHVSFVYDFAHAWWTDEEKKTYHKYIFDCRDKNVDEEFSPFHDGWWGYKNWGFVLGLLAVLGETEKEPYMLYLIDREFRTVSAEALKLAGDGGAYAEGFYVHGYLGVWMMAMEAMWQCMGVDWFKEAEGFYKNRALASRLEHYPTIRERGSRRPVCVGDGRGRFFKVDRDHAMLADRILVSHYRDDAANQAMNAYLHTTPHQGADENAWREFLFFDPMVKQGNLKKFKLSHASKGAGFVYARSSWEDDATYFFFKSGKRFTSHQHLDNGHFYIFKHEELAAEGGQYHSFHDDHGCNYYSRTIAHNTILVKHPGEVWENIRAFSGPTANDGGQAFPWPGTCFWHGGDASDADTWRRHPELGDIADLLAYQDEGPFMYTAGDCTRSYWKGKLELFTRQIVFIRPGTFVIFDRVKSRDPSYKKSWLLQAAKVPEQRDGKLVVTQGKGRLFVQTLLPVETNTTLHHGEKLYEYDGVNHPWEHEYGAETECRVEISPAVAAKEDLFLHVLTATDSGVEKVADAKVEVKKGKVIVTVGKVKVEFLTGKVGGSVTVKGKKVKLAEKIVQK